MRQPAGEIIETNSRLLLYRSPVFFSAFVIIRHNFIIDYNNIKNPNCQVVDDTLDTSTTLISECSRLQIADLSPLTLLIRGNKKKSKESRRRYDGRTKRVEFQLNEPHL